MTMKREIDLSPAAVARRHEEMRQLDRPGGGDRRTESRLLPMNKAVMSSIDMSPSAVARRHETVQSLYELMVSFRGARITGRVRDRPTREPNPR